MEIKIKLHTVVIKDEDSSQVFKVSTLRSAEEIAGCIEESEKDEIVDKLEQEVGQVINKQ